MVKQPRVQVGYSETMVDELATLREKFPHATDYALRLKMAMELDAWNDSRLAGELGISGAAIGKFWSGKTKMFTAENHVRACQKLRVDSEWLALGIGEPRPERMNVRDLNGLEGQLIMLFRGSFQEDQDELLLRANEAYAKRHPLPSAANPFGGAPSPVPTATATKGAKQ